MATSKKAKSNYGKITRIQAKIDAQIGELASIDEFSLLRTGRLKKAPDMKTQEGRNIAVGRRQYLDEDVVSRQKILDDILLTKKEHKGKGWKLARKLKDVIRKEISEFGAKPNRGTEGTIGVFKKIISGEAKSIKDAKTKDIYKERRDFIYEMNEEIRKNPNSERAQQMKSILGKEYTEAIESLGLIVKPNKSNKSKTSDIEDT